jgi:proline iminopeptidase
MIPVAGQYVAELNGVELGYTIIGKGPPLVVVAPGWGIGSHYLQRGLAPLALRFTMIFVDPRGSGRSGRPADNAAMSSAVMAEDIHALTQHLKLAPVDLIAHSNGGAIALAFAANHPDACGKLALVDSQLMGFAASEATRQILALAKDDPRYRSAVRSVGFPLPRTDDDFTAQLKNLLPLYFHHPQKMLPRFLQTMDGLVSAETFHAQSAADRAAAINQIETLGRIRACSLVMVGQHDWICPLHVSKRIHSGLSSSTLEIFEFSGHFPWIEEPVRFFGTLKSFLNSTGNDRATAPIVASHGDKAEQD